jgi:4,5-DOPA dioxygenase extradiol
MSERMPVIFVGHGSPLNAIENNKYTAAWSGIAEKIERKPAAILCISAHWFTPGSRVADSSEPKMIYDMYGFPDELYKVVYPAPGSPGFARLTRELIGDKVQFDNSRGLDHGTWSVLCRIYPEADIPVFQLSVDSRALAEEYLNIGRKLRSLREQGVLILGSGNVVHNLARVSWNMDGGYSWAEDFDNYIKENILSRKDENIVHFERAGASASLAVPSMDHFAPLLYVLGAADGTDHVRIFNDSCALGALSITSCLFAPNLD